VDEARVVAEPEADIQQQRNVQRRQAVVSHVFLTSFADRRRSLVISL